MYFNLIERYIFRRAMVATLVTLGSLTSVVWVVQALRKLDVITTKGAAILVYLQLTTFAVPMLILAIIPLALLVATIFTINSLNSSSELVVINASGASNFTMAKPLITLALLCSLFVGFVGHFVISWSLISLKTMAALMKADLISIVVQEGAFTKIEEGLTFHIAKRDAGGLLAGILISDDRDEKISIVYTAREGVVTKINGSAAILLKNGEIHQQNHADGAATVISYESYAFDLSTFAGKIRKLKLRPKERTTPDLMNPDKDDYYYKKEPGLYRSAIHERFSEMLWPFTYVILLLAFAGQARSTRQSYGTAIIAAVALILVLRGVAFSGVSSLKSNSNALYVVYGMPIFGIIFGGSFLIFNRPVALPKSYSSYVGRQQLRISEQFERKYASYLLFLRKRAGAGS